MVYILPTSPGTRNPTTCLSLTPPDFSPRSFFYPLPSITARRSEKPTTSLARMVTPPGRKSGVDTLISCRQSVDGRSSLASSESVDTSSVERFEDAVPPSEADGSGESRMGSEVSGTGEESGLPTAEEGDITPPIDEPLHIYPVNPSGTPGTTRAFGEGSPLGSWGYSGKIFLTFIYISGSG